MIELNLETLNMDQLAREGNLVVISLNERSNKIVAKLIVFLHIHSSI